MVIKSENLEGIMEIQMKETVTTRVTLTRNDIDSLLHGCHICCPLADSKADDRDMYLSIELSKEDQLDES